jgi:leukotriene-A4 hydrolase
MRVREALTFTQTYTARVASVLPVLLSAIRVSPPSEGPAHDGKIIGNDVVSYVYKQVCAIFASQD